MSQYNIESLMEQFQNLRYIMMKMQKFTEVTKSEFFILHMIDMYRTDGGTMPINEISKRVHTSKSALSQVLRSLEEKNYIVKKASLKDRRANVVTLTDEGQAVLSSCYDKFQKKIKQVMDMVGPETMQRFSESFGELIHALEEIEVQE